MRFKNKTGWILEELEKKNECLDANEFGGENPEDVEKQREENDKEINKRFDGVRKTLKKVVGDDHEEKGKPHKVEEHFKTRKELAEATKELKDSEIKFTINRSTKEGFRYVLEYFTTARPKDAEPLFEKIELEEGSIEDLQRHLGNKLLPPKDSKKKNEYELYWFDTEDCRGDATFKRFPTMKAAKAWYDAHHDDADKFNMAYPDTYRDTLESLEEELYTKQDVFDSLNDYIDVLEHDRKRTPEGEVNDTLRNVIGALKDIINDLKESLKEDLPDAIPEEPLVVSTDVAPEIPAEVVPDEVVQTGIYSALSSELRDTLADIENLKSLTVTLVDEGKEDIIDDLNTIIDDRTIHVGMLQTLMEKVDAKVEAEETNTVQDKEDMMDAEIVEPDNVKEESLKEDDGDKKDNWISVGIFGKTLEDSLGDGYIQFFNDEEKCKEEYKELTFDKLLKRIKEDSNFHLDGSAEDVNIFLVDRMIGDDEVETDVIKKSNSIKEAPKEESLKEAVDIHVEDNEIIVSKDLEDVAIIPVDGEEEVKEESLNEEWQYCNCKDLDEVAKLSDYCAKNDCKITAKTPTNDGYKCRIEGPFDNVHKVNDKWSMFKWRGTPLEEEKKDESLNEELEAGDCVYHPEKDEYYYLKKTDKPNKFELYTHSDSRGFEIASPRFIDKNSPFYNKLKLQTKNANPEFKESLNEDMKPWMMQQGDNGEPEYIGFAKSHDDMLDKMVKSHASDSIGKETYINELDKDTYEYIKKDLSDDEVKELDNYFKECLKEDLDLHDKVFNIFGGEMKDADIDSYIDSIKKTHNFESDDELLKYIEDNKEE